MYIEQNLLSDLLNRIQNFNHSSSLYFNYIGKYELVSIQPARQIYSDNESEDFLIDLEIQSIQLSDLVESLMPKWSVPNNVMDTGQSSWHTYKIKSIIDHLNGVLKDHRISSVRGMERIPPSAGDLRFDAFKSPYKGNYNFIFYLGDTEIGSQARRILDTIHDFSDREEVTLVLTEQEAIHLWSVLQNELREVVPLCGREVSLKEKFEDIVNNLQLRHLLIYSGDHALSIDRQEQFKLLAMRPDDVDLSIESKAIFSSAYCLGLLLDLENSHCLALALEAAGAHAENAGGPNIEAIQRHLKNRIGQLVTWETPA